MAQRKLLTNGNAFKRTDNRWGGVVWYMDEQGERKRKSFSGTTKAEVNQKMTDYIANFTAEVVESDQARKTLKESMPHWLQVFKFPSVERTTYDRCECTAEHQIYGFSFPFSMFGSMNSFRAYSHKISEPSEVRRFRSIT